MSKFIIRNITKHRSETGVILEVGSLSLAFLWQSTPPTRKEGLRIPVPVQGSAPPRCQGPMPDYAAGTLLVSLLEAAMPWGSLTKCLYPR